jgi:lipoprotein-anchoring transpeptidase ErfK/SrfK
MVQGSVDASDARNFTERCEIQHLLSMNGVSELMRRIGVFVLTALTCGLPAALAQPLVLSPGSPAASRVIIMAQPQTERLDLGGGFIEFLFGARGPQPLVAPPPSADVRPIYINTAPAAGLEYDPSQPVPPMEQKYLRQEVDYTGKEEPGTIVIDTPNRFLYLVQPNGRALRYGIGVGRPGFTWSGVHKITAKREWPDWRPPDEMLQRQPFLPHFMPGGPNNPLGARALYLGSTLYRIHGSNEPWTIGRMVSSGCIRMRNEDVVDLYTRVTVGTKVVVI